MLYEQIRYAEDIRKLYRLRHLLLRRRHPAIDSLLGYSKRSMQFYRIKKVLQSERVLDRDGKFIENAPNLRMADLAVHLSKQQAKVLGNKVPYRIFLAESIQSQPETMIRTLPKDLLFTRQTVHYAVSKLLAAMILARNNDGTIKANEKLREWLMSYINISKSHADATGDIHYLFSAVPGYISGPAAAFILKYEAGRPIGPSDMVITTYRPFKTLWESLVKQTRYFNEYPKKVEVGLAHPRDEIIWIRGIPYNNKETLSRERWGKAQ